MTTKKLTKLLALYLPYLLLGLVATNLGEAWRLAEGKELGDKIMSMMGTIPVAFADPLPSLHPLDLLVGLCCGAGLWLAVYLKGKNAKKYRHGMEYGSARWGTPKDIEPFMAPKFEDNIILTKTERLMMSNRPPDPKNARNKNVLVVGGSGSGKTRFWLKPNLLQCHSSYVVTDPKGSIVVECGNALLKNGYKLKILNTINFSKSISAFSFLQGGIDLNVFEAVKQSVTTRQAAEHYGIRVNRNGMACCPFHNDKTPSMKLDKRFHCFGCGADGDVIDFVAALYGLGKKEAAAQLASDFGLAYEDWKPPGRARKPKPRQKSPEEQFREAKAHCFRVLADYLHLLRVWKTDYAPHSPEEAFHPRFVEALQKQAHVEYLLDVLLFGETEEKAALITDYGKDVIQLEQRMAELAAADAARTKKHHERHAAATERP